MNNKISSLEIIGLLVASFVTMFFDFCNPYMLSVAKNSSIISLLIVFVIGFIPLFMIYFISTKIDKDFYTFLKDKFKFFGTVIFTLLTLYLIYLFFTTTFIVVDFAISQFLTGTSYYFITLLFSFVIFISVNKGFEVISRTVYILFIMVIFTVIFFLSFLIPYIDLSNFKPVLDTSFLNIIKSSIVLFCSTLPIYIFFLNIKDKVKKKDKSKIKTRLIASFIISIVFILLFLFFTTAVYGTNIASIMTYPTYSLFKKIQIFGFIERVENFAAVILITGYYSCASFFTYIIKDNIMKITNTKNKKKELFIILSISFVIPMISTYVFKKYDLINLFNITPYIVGTIFIFIIIIFIRCLFIKKN